MAHTAHRYWDMRILRPLAVIAVMAMPLAALAVEAGLPLSDPLPLTLQDNQPDTSTSLAFFRHPLVGTENFSPATACIRIGATCYAIDDYVTIGSRVAMECTTSVGQEVGQFLQEYIDGIVHFMTEGYTEAEKASIAPLCASADVAADIDQYWNAQCALAPGGDCTLWAKKAKKWCRMQSENSPEAIAQQADFYCSKPLFFASVPKMCDAATACLAAGKAVTSADCPAYFAACPATPAATQMCAALIDTIAPYCAGVKEQLAVCTSPDPCAGKSESACTTFLATCDLMSGKAPSGVLTPQVVVADVRNTGADASALINTGEWKDPYVQGHPSVSGTNGAMTAVANGDAPDGIVLIVPRPSAPVSAGGDSIEVPTTATLQYTRFGPDGRLRLHSIGTSWYRPGMFGPTSPCGMLFMALLIQEPVDPQIEAECKSTLNKHKAEEWAVLISAARLSGSGELVVANRGDGTTAFVTMYRAKGFPKQAETFHDLFDWAGWANLSGSEPYGSAVLTDRVGEQSLESVLIATNRPTAGGLYTVNRVTASNAQVAVQPIEVGSTGNTDGYGPFRVTASPRARDLNGDGLGDFVLTWWRPAQGELPARFAPYVTVHLSQPDGTFTPLVIHAPTVAEDGSGAMLERAQILHTALVDVTRDDAPDLLLGDYHPYLMGGKREVSVFLCPGDKGVIDCLNAQRIRMNTDAYTPPAETPHIGGVRFLSVDQFGNIGTAIGPWSPYPADVCPDLPKIQIDPADCPPFEPGKGLPPEDPVEEPPPGPVKVLPPGAIVVPPGDGASRAVSRMRRDLVIDPNPRVLGYEGDLVLAAIAGGEGGGIDGMVEPDPGTLMVPFGAGPHPAPGQVTVRVNLQTKKATEPPPPTDPAPKGTACRMECGRLNGQRAHPHPLGHDWVTALNDRWRAATGSDSDMFCATEGGEYTVTCIFPTGQETVVLNATDGAAFVPLYKMRGMYPINYFADPFHPPGKDKVLKRAVALSPSPQHMTGQGAVVGIGVGGGGGTGIGPTVGPAAHFDYDSLQAIVPNSTVQVGQGVYLINDILKFTTYVQPVGATQKGIGAPGTAMQTVAVLQEKLGPNLCDWATPTCPPAVRASPVEQRHIQPDDLIAAMGSFRKALGRPVTTGDLGDFFKQFTWDNDHALLQEYAVAGLRGFVAGVDMGYAASGGADCSCRLTRRPPDRASIALALVAAALSAALFWHWRRRSN